MTYNKSVIKNDERAIFELRSVYQKYGYTQYKMEKFEDYDLYVRNKDFLISNKIITFTDTNGKLKALKPDVTLSIIKNFKEETGYVQKLYYNENVYRVPNGGGGFKEIMQAGLECIGDITDYEIFEALLLAIKSLERINEDFVIDISYLDIVTAVLEKVDCTADVKNKIAECIGQKNIDEIEKISHENNITNEVMDKILSLSSLYGKIDYVIPKLKEICDTEEAYNAFIRLEKICNALNLSEYKNKINIDFSIVNDMNYYNGLVFKGYVKGIPASVLSGGQYDNLMKKIGKASRAVGFAVYLDILERLNNDEAEYDVDTLIIYGKGVDINTVIDAANKITGEGKSVLVERSIPVGIKYRALLNLTTKEQGINE